MINFAGGFPCREFGDYRADQQRDAMTHTINRHPFRCALMKSSSWPMAAGRGPPI
jgi:hypothetical protein